MQRRLTVVSDPPGALLKIDDHEIGTTPVSTSFTHYGTRRIQLIKDGYETLTVLQPVPTPWYQYPGLDFFSDNLAMHEIRDNRTLRYQLQPMRTPATDELMRRGEHLRDYGQTPPNLGVTPGVIGPPAAGTAPPYIPNQEFGPGYPFGPAPGTAPPGVTPPPPFAPTAPFAPAAPTVIPPPAGFMPNPNIVPAPGTAAPLSPPTSALPTGPNLLPAGSRLPH